MTMRLLIDSEIRVVLPQLFRKELRLEPGDSLEMESAGEQITLRPIRESGSLSREKGVWVFHAGHPLPASATDAMLQQIRADRDLTNLNTRE